MPVSNTTAVDILTYESVRQYAREHGCDRAYGLLLLAGPDGYAGTWEEYNEALYLLDHQLILNEPEE